MTLDHLARLMQNEFSGVRNEFSGMQKEFSSVKSELTTLHRMNQVFIDRFDNLDNQIGQLRLTTNSLVKMVADRDREMRGIDLRLRRVERRLGLLNT